MPILWNTPHGSHAVRGRGLGMSSYSEEYFEGHYRVVRVDYPPFRLYSIDYYELLGWDPDCADSISLPGIAELCYVDLGGGCQAVILKTEGRVEVVNLRLVTTVESDVAGGSHARAREFCTSKFRDWMGAGR